MTGHLTHHRSRSQRESLVQVCPVILWSGPEPLHTTPAPHTHTTLITRHTHTHTHMCMYTCMHTHTSYHTHHTVSLTHSLTHPLPHSITHSLPHPLTQLIHSLTRHLLTHSLTHSLTPSLSHSLSHSHSLTPQTTTATYNSSLPPSANATNSPLAIKALQTCRPLHTSKHPPPPLSPSPACLSHRAYTYPLHPTISSAANFNLFIHYPINRSLTHVV